MKDLTKKEKRPRLVKIKSLAELRRIAMKQLREMKAKNAKENYD